MPSIDALAAAYLFAQGKTQAEIADILQISQSTVSRQRQEVSSLYIEERRRFRRENLGEEMWRQVLWRTSPRTANAKLRDWAQRHGQAAPLVHYTAGAERVTDPNRDEI